MKRGLIGGLVGLFLAAMLVLLVGFNLTKTRILVLHSGGRDNGWVQRVDEGIRAVLAGNRLPVSVHWHYLAMERHPLEEDRQDAAALARHAIAQLRPHLLLAVDDEAQAYVAQQFALPTSAASMPAGQAPMRIVFAGIDREPADYGYANTANVSGIAERLPLAAIRDALLALRSGQPVRIAVLGAADETGRGQMQQATAFDWAPHRIAVALTLPDFKSWRQAIEGLNDNNNADVLLVLSFGGLPASAGSAKASGMAEVAGWIEAQAKPMPIGIGSSFVENGGGLAIAPSPREIGEVAMRQSLDWVRVPGVAGGAPPVVRQNMHYRVLVREDALRLRGVQLPSIYLEAARLERMSAPP